MKAGLFKYLITVIIVVLAVWAAVSLYSRYIANPGTRDGQVRANIDDDVILPWKLESNGR